ncbi:hypothetical protein H2200_000341 [Cladophialophora chaetospira]|uniref:Uncharacterized protein n=1 Tax=Cladophialophora chaetospira TaxID=386627 RepID=A0AA38XND5_9EURO|nr:hypothetical protein H2200_000341 [Cladophialophora chaetospira]
MLPTGAVWLDPTTPTNFNTGRNLTQAQLIGLRASFYSRQRRIQSPSQLIEAPSNTSSLIARQNTFAVLKRDHVAENGNASARTRQHPEHLRRDTTKHSQPQNRLSVRIRSPDTILRYGSSDPFQSTPVHLTARNYYVVNTAKIWTSLRIFPAEMHSRSGQYIYDESFKRFVHNYFTDEAGSHAAMCLCWTVMSRLNLEEREMCLTRSFAHSAKAMEALRSTIAGLEQGGIEIEKVIRVVHLHCAAALWLGDRSAVMYHQDALRRLVGLIGGLRQLDPLLQCFTTYLIVRIALNTMTRTVLDPMEWDPERLSAFQEDTESAATALTEPWKRVFVDLRELALVERLAEREVDYLQWCYLRRQAIKARVTNIWCEFTDPDATDPVPGIIPVPTQVHKSSLDMCMCLAVQNYIVVASEPSTIAQQTISSTQIFHIMLIRCLAKLEVDLEQLRSDFPRARDLLWVLSVGAVMEIKISSSQSKKPVLWIDGDMEELRLSWFLLRFGILALSLGYKKYEDVEELFEKGYVYSPAVQEPILRCAFYSAAGLNVGLFAGLWDFTRSEASA